MFISSCTKHFFLFLALPLHNFSQISDPYINTSQTNSDETLFTQLKKATCRISERRITLPREAYLPVSLRVTFLAIMSNEDANPEHMQTQIHHAHPPFSMRNFTAVELQGQRAA